MRRRNGTLLFTTVQCFALLYNIPVKKVAPFIIHNGNLRKRRGKEVDDILESRWELEINVRKKRSYYAHVH